MESYLTFWRSNADHLFNSSGLTVTAVVKLLVYVHSGGILQTKRADCLVER
jgi:hypothetical protein